MRKKNRNRITFSVVSGLAFLFVLVLCVQHPPQKRDLRATTELS